MQVKIYDNELNPLTTLSTQDVENLQYTNSLYSSGSASFLLRSDNSKLNTNVLTQYNRVKIFIDTTCVFYGFINSVDYSLDTLQVNVVHISEILQNRSTGGSFFANGTMSQVLTNLLLQANSTANTGISIGTVANISGIYAKTYNSGESVREILDDLLSIYQYYIDNEGKLHANTLLGNDLSSRIKLVYDVNQPRSSNITNFKVSESSQRLFTKITAMADGRTTQVVQDNNLISKFGVVETTRKYYQVYSDQELTDKATADLKGASYTPEITFTKIIPFEVTDIVTVRLNNNIVNFTEAYQVIEKSVTFIGGELKTTIKFNDQQKNVIDYLVDLRKKVKLLETT